MTTSELYSIFQKYPYISTDSRLITKNSLFFALKGKNFNGNKFAEKAINQGCYCAIVDEHKYANHSGVILVENVLETLQKLAKFHREKLNIPIIGITGTNGKTTSKELIHNVLNSELNCHATKGNLNNHIGVPLSILEIKDNHDIAIIEMGANHRKEIDHLCSIAKPTHGVITNIGTAHLQGFKSLRGVIKAKNELFSFIKENGGLIFINNDDSLLVKLAVDIKKVSYGVSSRFSTSIISNTPFLNVKWEDTIIKSKLIGDYQLYNISLALCIGNYFDIAKKKIQVAIESYVPANNRSEIRKTENNSIIMDAYNANPSSMKAMIESFANQDYKNKLCILGDMLELGSYSNKEHNKILELCKRLKLESLFVGKEFSKLSEESFKNISDLKEFIKQHPIKKKRILLKGSRGIGLEKLIEYL